ncbi:MAG: hypothetical protein ACNS64_08155 [Candidatus Halalkalibacterium sp. M3_1C_030]
MKEIENIIDRVLWLVKYCKDNNVRGIKYARDITDGANLGNSYISDLKSGRVKYPSAEAIGKISEFTGARIEWLISGKGEPIEQNESKKIEAAELEDTFERNFNKIKEGSISDKSFQKLLFVFRDQLKSQINQNQSLIYQLESMLHLINISLNTDEKIG